MTDIPRNYEAKPSLPRTEYEKFSAFTLNELVPVFGASTNLMSRNGLCMSGYDDKSKNTLALFEPA